MTSIADTSYAGWTVARAARAAGLRARVYLEVFGLDDAELPSTMARLEAGLRRLQGECGSTVEAGLSPHASVHRFGPPVSGGGALRAPRRPPPGHACGGIGGRGGVARSRHGRDRPGISGGAHVEGPTLDSAGSEPGAVRRRAREHWGRRRWSFTRCRWMKTTSPRWPRAERR